MPLPRKFNQEGQPLRKEEPADLWLKLKLRLNQSPAARGQPGREGATTLRGPQPRVLNSLTLLGIFHTQVCT